MGECCSTNQSCGSKSSCCSHTPASHESCPSQSHPEGFTGYFLEIADQAWEEVLKDEIKEYILATQKERMKGLAKIVAEGNNQRWRHKMEKKKGCSSFREELESFMSQPKK